jgi:hypothetical protein
MASQTQSDQTQAALADVLITLELSRRKSRRPNYAAENQALAGEMTTNPENILQKLVEVALELCRADSTGISILESSEGSGVFRWHTIAGPFAYHLGSPRPAILRSRRARSSWWTTIPPPLTHLPSC